MKKIVIFVIILVSLIFIGQGTYLYFNINKPQQVMEEAVQQYIDENLDVKDVTFSNFYNGTESYQIFEGKDDDGNGIFIWIKDTLDLHMIKKKEDGLSYNEVLDFANKELEPKEIISIKLGMENSLPLYEITYINQENRYSYYYISFEDGTYLKHYHLKT